MPGGVLFTREDAARIARVVRDIEASRGLGTRLSHNSIAPDVVFPAKLTGGDKTNGYVWIEVRQRVAGTFEDVSGGRNSADLGVAFEDSDQTIDCGATPIVRLHQRWDDKANDDKGRWGFGFAIGGSGGVPIKLTGAAAKGGTYAGSLGVRTATPFDPTAAGTLSLAAIYAATGTAVTVVNNEEDGTNAWLITPPLWVAGVNSGYLDAGGKPIYHFNRKLTAVAGVVLRYNGVALNGGDPVSIIDLRGSGTGEHGLADIISLGMVSGSIAVLDGLALGSSKHNRVVQYSNVTGKLNVSPVKAI